MLNPPMDPEVFPYKRMRGVIEKYTSGLSLRYQLSIEPNQKLVAHDSDIWWDARWGLKLVQSNGLTHSVVAFECLEKVLQVKQLQEMKFRGDSREHCSGFRWERLLLAAVCVLAQYTLGCKEVRVLKAEFTPWYNDLPNHADRSIEEYQAGLKRRYDGTARALKFKKCPKMNEWVLPVNQAV